MSTDPRDVPRGVPLGGESEPLPDAVRLTVDDADGLTVPVGPAPAVLRFSVPGGIPGGRWEPVSLQIEVRSPNLITSLEVRGPDPRSLDVPADVVGGIGTSYSVGPHVFAPGDYWVTLKPFTGGSAGQVKVWVVRPSRWDRIRDGILNWFGK